MTHELDDRIGTRAIHDLTPINLLQKHRHLAWRCDIFLDSVEQLVRAGRTLRIDSIKAFAQLLQRQLSTRPVVEASLVENHFKSRSIDPDLIESQTSHPRSDIGGADSIDQNIGGRGGRHARPCAYR